MGKRFHYREKFSKSIIHTKSQIGKSLIKKTLIGCVLTGNIFFGDPAISQNQEEDRPRYNTPTHYIIKEVQKNPFIELKTLEEIIDKSKKIVKENYKGDPHQTDEAKNLMKIINDSILNKYPQLNRDYGGYKKSLVYLSIGEENKLPLYLVNISSPFLDIFMRWDPDGEHEYLGENIRDTTKEYRSLKTLVQKDMPIEEELRRKKLNKGDFNFETSKSLYPTDEDYFVKSGFSYREIENEIFFKNLTKKEYLSIAYTEESKELSAEKKIYHFVNSKIYEKEKIIPNKEQYSQALEFIDKAIGLNPKNYSAHFQRGAILFSISKKECDTKKLNYSYCKDLLNQACESYKKAGEINTSARIPYAFLGKLFYFIKKYEEAEHYLTKEIERYKKGETKSDYLLKRATFYLLTNKKDDAERDFIQAFNLKSDALKIIKNKDRFFYVHNKNKEIDNWYKAKRDCREKTDELKWRLPSIKELDLIYREKIDLPKNKYWSATRNKIKNVLVKNLDDGSVTSIKKEPRIKDKENYKGIFNVCIRVLEKNEKEELFKQLEQNSWFIF